MGHNLLTRKSASMLVQHSTRPSKGLDESKGLSEVGGDSILVKARHCSKRII